MLSAFAFFVRDRSGRPWPNGFTESGACYFTVNSLPVLPVEAGCFWDRSQQEWTTCFVGEDEREFNFAIYQGRIYRSL